MVEKIKEMKNLLNPDEVEIALELKKKLQIVKEIFTNQRVIVGFSGGMNSTFVCYLAKFYADEVLPIIVKDPTTSMQELIQAGRYTQLFQIPLRVIELNTLNIKEFVENRVDRCYYCKKNLLTELEKIANQENYTLVVDGTNESDLSDIRPGIKALQESHARSPLAEAHITKDEIRYISKLLNLPSANLPSQACLASRVPFLTPINEQLLKAIDEAEQYIKDLTHDPTLPLRVRIHPMKTENKWLARIESNSKIFEYLSNPTIREQIIKRFYELGFIFVTLDLEGFISGKMHRIYK